MACSPQSKIAPRYLFPSHRNKYPGFQVGQYLEYLDPAPNKVDIQSPATNIAKILEVNEHMLKLEVGLSIFYT